MTTRALTKVERLPDACFVKWKLLDGTIVDQEITQAQYIALRDRRDDSTLTPPAAGASRSVNHDGTGVCFTEYRVTGNRRLQSGDIVPLVYGPGMFGLDDQKSGDTHMVVVGSHLLRLNAADITGDLDDPRALTVTGVLRDGAQIVNGQLIEPD